MFDFRCDNNNSEHSGARDEEQRPGVRGERPPRPSLLPDTADGADGPARRHLEAPRQRRLRSSTSKPIYFLQLKI